MRPADKPMQPDPTRRRILLSTLVASVLSTACAAPSPGAPERPPIVFVHGDSDTAGVWMTTIWRFESNGWPRDRLHAIDLPYPTARTDDTKAEDGRSSTADHRTHIAAEVDKVLATTGARQVVLYGLSRGGYGIRDYVAHGGAAKVSAVVLGGTPNHGVYADAAQRLGSEYNGDRKSTRLNSSHSS